MPYDNTNKIAIFKNDKGDNPKRPDYRGTLNIDGREYKCSLWIREKKDGSGMKYMQGGIEPAKEGEMRAGDSRPMPTPAPAPQTPANAAQSPKDEDVPF